MTRKEVMELKKYILPKKYKEGRKNSESESVYITMVGEASKAEAMEKLKQLQEVYSIENGWYCPAGIHEGVFQDDDKLWYAYRHQAQYVRKK